MLRQFTCALGLLTLSAFTLAGDPAKVRQKLYITNSAGDDITVADTATNKVIGRIEVGSHPHGIAVPAKRDFLLVSIEGAKPGEIVWVDPKTDAVTRRLAVGPAPNQLAITPDGKFAYVPAGDGHYDVVDVAAAKVIERIKTGGRPHNTLSSADGQRMYLAPLIKNVTIVDVATHKPIGEIVFSNNVRPIAITKDEKRFFAEVDGLIGIEVADIASRKMIHRVPAELSLETKKTGSRSHGLGLRPDEKEAWECDVEHKDVHVFDITSDRPKQIATVPVGGTPYWLTFDPAGRFCYVACRSTNDVAVIDTSSKEVIARIPAGKEPKRLVVVDMP